MQQEPSQTDENAADEPTRTDHSAPRADLDLTIKLPERYEFVEKIGEGGFGYVLKARQKHPARVVAIKITEMKASNLDEADEKAVAEKRRFLREADAVATLKHPGIVPIYEFGEAEGRYFFSMEFVEGVPLDRYVREHEQCRVGLAPPKESEPIEARPASVLYRLRKAVQRHRVATAVISGFLIALAVAFVWVNTAKREVERQRLRAEKARTAEEEQRRSAERAKAAEQQQRKVAEKAAEAEAKQRKAAEKAEQEAEKAAEAESEERKVAEYASYVNVIGAADTQIRGFRFDEAREMLLQAPKRLRGWEWGRLMYLCHLDVLTLTLPGAHRRDRLRCLQRRWRANPFMRIFGKYQDMGRGNRMGTADNRGPMLRLSGFLRQWWQVHCLAE